ncbi:unnamed protein product [Owenia fusiformis]|uniref:G-protein coupled receptors family 1 profile domain-containing protein n=1 Tax=Owenia fusiformis TaxID=6347 RepID=A0A8S4NRB1_OWEFU|nr:unnamed protein product [Owenia fusiformis]
MVGLSSVIVPITIYTLDYLPYSLCQLASFLLAGAFEKSIYTIALLSLDKYITITQPLFYQRSVTVRKTVIFLCILWVFSFLCWLPVFTNNIADFDTAISICFINPLADPVQVIVMVSIVFGTSSIIIGFCNIGILRISWRQKKQIQSLTLTGSKQGNTTNMKAFRTILFLVLVFYISWTPFCLEWIIRAFSGFTGTPKALLCTFLLLSMSNSFWNAVIYTATNKPFRESAFAIFCRRHGQFQFSSAVKTINLKQSEM